MAGGGAVSARNLATEDDLRRLGLQPDAPPDPRLLESEATFQRAILSYLDAFGWIAFHDTDSRQSRVGFPDLVATNGRVLLLVELKSMKGRIRPEQQAWADALSGVTTLVSGIFRPDQTDALYGLIRRGCPLNESESLVNKRDIQRVVL